MREQYDLPIGKLNSVVVRAWIVQVDLPESSNPVRDVTRLFLEQAQQKPGLLSLNVVFERELCTREEAHGHFRFSDRRESVCCGVPKLGRDQLVSDLGRP